MFEDGGGEILECWDLWIRIKNEVILNFGGEGKKGRWGSNATDGNILTSIVSYSKKNYETMLSHSLYMKESEIILDSKHTFLQDLLIFSHDNKFNSQNLSYFLNMD
ncbi:hypothetical protein RJT34_17235 [Clitoria ternatea]|uniref:Uncharacterized protein n=1 Tax=Clitoria ternatea TaxID=43366 RepID=A0AAN9JA71_CLITE